MNSTPVCELIKTSRLIIEPFKESCLRKGIVEWLNDPEVVRYSDQRHRVHTIETSRAYLESFAESANGYWTISLREMPETMIGSLTAYVDLPNAVADVGILIGDKRYWRGGYGSEAVTGLIDWLFVRRGMRKVTAGTMEANTGMLGIMRRVGMHEEGRRKRYYILGSREVDMVLSAVFAEEWSNLKASQGVR